MLWCSMHLSSSAAWAWARRALCCPHASPELSLWRPQSSQSLLWTPLVAGYATLSFGSLQIHVQALYHRLCPRMQAHYISHSVKAQGAVQSLRWQKQSVCLRDGCCVSQSARQKVRCSEVRLWLLQNALQVHAYENWDFLASTLIINEYRVTIKQVLFLQGGVQMFVSRGGGCHCASQINAPMKRPSHSSYKLCRRRIHMPS